MRRIGVNWYIWLLSVALGGANTTPVELMFTVHGRPFFVMWILHVMQWQIPAT